MLGQGQLEKKQNKAINLLSKCLLSFQKLFEDKIHFIYSLLA